MRGGVREQGVEVGVAGQARILRVLERIQRHQRQNVGALGLACGRQGITHQAPPRDDDRSKQAQSKRTSWSGWVGWPGSAARRETVSGSVRGQIQILWHNSLARSVARPLPDLLRHRRRGVDPHPSGRRRGDALMLPWWLGAATRSSRGGGVGRHNQGGMGLGRMACLVKRLQNSTSSQVRK